VVFTATNPSADVLVDGVDGDGVGVCLLCRGGEGRAIKPAFVWEASILGAAELDPSCAESHDSLQKTWGTITKNCHLRGFVAIYHITTVSLRLTFKI